MSKNNTMFTIKDDPSFKSFVLNCAKTFGGHIKPDSYHLGEMYKCEKKLIELTFMSDSEITDLLREYENAEIDRIERIKEKEHQRLVYENMLNEIINWNPPTPDHQELKKFMINKIESSIKFDEIYLNNYYDTPTIRYTAQEWRNMRIEALKNNIKYNKKLYLEEVARARNKRDWLMTLKNSLKDV